MFNLYILWLDKCTSDTTLRGVDKFLNWEGGGGSANFGHGHFRIRLINA